MRAFALTCEAVASLSRTEAKVQCAAAYLRSRPEEELPVAARFLAGSPLPPGRDPPRIGAATLVPMLAARCGLRPQGLLRRAIRKGDLGDAVAASWKQRSPAGASPPLAEVAATLEALGVAGPRERHRRLDSLLERAGALEAKYLVKLLLGSLRTGMQAGRVEDAIAMAFDVPGAAVRRAHLILGDIGLVAIHAARDSLDRVRLRPFRPVRCMLAHPVDSADEVRRLLPGPAVGEDKYDGVRAQLHVARRRAHLYSRSQETLTHLFPELADAPSLLEGDWILDGEVVAWQDERALPFAELQQRLGRRQVPLTLLLDVPVVFQAFDVLWLDGQELLEVPLRDRKALLQRLPPEGPLRQAPWELVEGRAGLEEVYRAALERGNEGAVFKDPSSPYRPGTRGRAWLKLKRPMGTLDVVVTGAEYGHGKRAGWLSDLTFAVRGPEGFLEIGKAYSGLTDAEIRELTGLFKATTVERRGALHRVRPTVVLEVAFGGIRRSRRHPSGYGLRFPRILRLRPDLRPEEVDTLEDVARMHRRRRRRSGSRPA